jgi:transcriptional regulator with XRE-family HTH domain
VRKAKKLSQKEFAQNINLSQNHISSLEKGVRAATDRIVSDICKVYNVNKEWLTTGKGEMFKDPLEPFIIEDPEIKELIDNFRQLDEDMQENIKNIVFKCIKK